MHPELKRVLEADSFVDLREHPALRRIVERASRSRVLVKLLPTIWTLPALATRPEVRAAALQRRHHDAVFIGATAAWLLLNGPAPDTIEGAVAGHLRPQSGFRFSEQIVPDEHVIIIDGLRVLAPGPTAVQLAAHDDGAAIDDAVRLGRTSIDALRRILASLPRRRGNRRRTEVLQDSRDEPWSQAERLAHGLLRRAGITGWSTNTPVKTTDGGRYRGDVVFESARLFLEIDGWATHRTKEAFQRDRERQNSLVLDGWRVLRFTWHTLTQAADQFIQQVELALMK